MGNYWMEVSDVGNLEKVRFACEELGLEEKSSNFPNWVYLGEVGIDEYFVSYVSSDEEFPLLIQTQCTDLSDIGLKKFVREISDIVDSEVYDYYAKDCVVDKSLLE